MRGASLVTVRLLLLAVLLALPVVVTGCYPNTNAPSGMGTTSPPQPPPKKIERTAQQWCVDYCTRVRSCWEQSKGAVGAEAAFTSCKKERKDCAVDKPTPQMCCAEMTSCSDFNACQKDGVLGGC